ncbi:MAG: LAGLIDADG family homing endonuclease [Limnochordia bacterium]|jgi:ribonucleoside-diphosphate reductase alpha chain
MLSHPPKSSAETAVDYVADDDRVQLEGISELVFLDRYAMKDPKKRFAVGDTVVVLVKEDPKFPQKEVGTVTAIDGDAVTVELKSTGEPFTQDRRKVDKPIELEPADMWDRMAQAIVEIEAPEKREELVKEFRWLLGNFRFSPGGRINTMLGTGQNLTAYNCYVIPLKSNTNKGTDSRQAIVDTLGNMVEIMSRGGGVGINLSPLRPRLSYVSGVNGRSSGSVSWGALFSFATGLVEQGGSRRGALMLILEDWHPDLLEFITAKRDMDAITNANTSVAISHAFMQAVADDADWDLVFPDTTDPEYDALWDGNLRKWRDELGKPVKTYRTMKARQLWDTIMESAWMSAEPGVVFLERMNEYSNSWYFEQLISTNPCVTGDTLLYTAQGLRRADDLYFADTSLTVATDSRLSSESFVAASPVFATGIKPVYRLNTNEGYSLRLTADHQVLTENKGWVAARDLEPGDKILVQNRGGCFGQNGDLDTGRVLGWLVGSRATNSQQAVISYAKAAQTEREHAFGAALQGAMQSVNAHGLGGAAIDSTGVVTVAEGAASVEQSDRVRELRAEYDLSGDKPQVPEHVFTGTSDMQIGFLQALFSAAGHIETNDDDSCAVAEAVTLPSVSLELLRGVQQVLLNHGIFCRIDQDHQAAGETPPDTHLDKAPLPAVRHQLRITGKDLLRFSEVIGFLTSGKASRLAALPTYGGVEPHVSEEPFLAEFTDLVPDGEEMVYDVTVPTTHAFAANGLVVHNCAEQPLPPWGVCNLGHINLSRFVHGSIGTAQVDWESLRRAIHLGVRFLDNIIDITPYFFPQNEEVQKSERRVGMGTMGLGEMLVRLGIRYGSPESLTFIDKLYGFIAAEAYKASAYLAKEKGSFPKCDVEKYLQSRFIQGLPDDVRALIAEHGTRNVCVLTQAPTGSTGTMIGTSTGIEPYYSWTYWRKGRLGVKEVQERIVEEYFAEHPEVVPQLDELPPYFVTAMELTPKEHIQVQAAIQRWTDSSISKTANAPNHYTMEQTKELYEFAYQSGCKGVTIYRDGSRDTQVLTKIDEKKESETSQATTDGAESMESGALGVTEAAQQSVAATNADQGCANLIWTGRPQKLEGATYEWPTPLGKAYITVNECKGEPIEVFINIGKAGSDIAAMSEALGRLATMFLKHAGMKSSDEKVGMLVKQLSDIGGSTSVGFGANRVSSVPDALAKTLKFHVEDSKRSRGIEVYISSGSSMDICPTCGVAALAREEGCFVCKACGYSKC